MITYNQSSRMNKRKQVLLLMSIGIILFFIRLGSVSVYQVAEARNAECAREMLTGKDWIVPMFNGQLRTDKPALEYFAMMAAYKIGGVNEGSARFFSAICGLLLVLFTFLIGYKYLGQKAAWWSALILLASPHLIAQFRLATPDPYLILLDTVALYCFIEGWMSSKIPLPRREWRWYVGMYIFLGLAGLAKGPVGLLLPALIIWLFLVVKKRFNWKTIRRLRPWWGALISLLFCAPWYVLVHIKTNGAWTKGFFLVHNVERFSGSMGGHGGIFLVTFAFVLAGMLPFTVFIVHTLGYVWKQRKENDLLLICIVATLCVIGFYALSRTKLINYTVPCYPFIALMTGAFLGHIMETGRFPKGLKIPFWILLVICMAIPAGMYFWTRSTPGLEHFGWLTYFFLLYPLGALAALIAFLRKEFRWGISFIAVAFMVSTAVLLAYPYPILDAQTPIRKQQKLLRQGRTIAAYKSFNNGFVFYIRHPVPILQDTLQLQGFLRRHPDALIISDARDHQALEKINGLELIRADREIFNTHTSWVYRLKNSP